MVSIAKVVQDGVGFTYYEYMYKMWNVYRCFDMLQKIYDNLSSELKPPLEKKWFITYDFNKFIIISSIEVIYFVY